MASAKQQKPASEACPQEQHKFWGSKVFGGNKPNTDQQVVKEPHQQNNGWWFGGHKQATNTAQTQHCNTCQCSTPDKSIKPTTCDGLNKKEHTIGVTITEERMTVKKDGKGTPPKLAAKTEIKEHHVGSLAHVKNNACTDAKKEQKENHCFRSMAGHVKQRIAMMKNNHGEKFSDSSSSDSDDERTDKKKKEKGHSQGTKATAK